MWDNVSYCLFPAQQHLVVAAKLFAGGYHLCCACRSLGEANLQTRPAATNTMLEVTAQEVQVTLRLDAACFGFVDLIDILRNSGVPTKTDHLCGTAAVRGLGEGLELSGVGS